MCECRQKGGQNTKRVEELDSYAYSFIADSAVLAKVAAHLLADIQPACSYTLPSQKMPMATHHRTADPHWFVIGCHTVYNPTMKFTLFAAADPKIAFLLVYFVVYGFPCVQYIKLFKLEVDYI